MTVNWLQVLLLCFSIRIAFDLVMVLPVSAAPSPNRDVWLVPLLVIPVAWLVGAIVIKLGSIFPDKTIIQYSRTLLGPVFGSILALLYAWWFIFFAALGVRISSDFFLNSVMIFTPVSVLMGLTLLTSVIAARRGLTTIALVNQVLGPVMLGLIWMLIFLSLNRLRPSNLSPFMAGGLGNLLTNAVTPMAVCSDIVNLAMVIPFMDNPAHASRVVKWGVPLGALHLMAIVLVVISSLGIDNAALATYPGLSVARRIAFGEFVQRVEPALLTVWLGGVFVQITLNLMWASQAMAQGFNLRCYKPLVLPLSVLVGLVALLLGENTLEYTALFDPTFFGPYSFTFSLVIPSLLLLVARIKRPAIKSPPETQT